MALTLKDTTWDTGLVLTAERKKPKLKYSANHDA
jgi:hypothetical protein